MRRWIADRLMGWCARHATVWPSQHAVHGGLLEEKKALFAALRRAHQVLDEGHDHTAETWADREEFATGGRR